MTTNTYQALCDDVGIEPSPCEIYQCNHACGGDECGYFIGFNSNKEWVYPPQSAEQVLRLEELIAKNIQNIHISMAISYRYLKWSDKPYQYYINRPFVKYWLSFSAKTRPQALYALTHKLFKEGVLSKEEVKEALNGK